MEKDQERKKPSFYGSAGLIAGGIFLSRILGLVREQVFAYFFGAGAVTDAFQIAFRIPNLLRDLFAEGAMSSALVPVYTKLRREKGEAEGWILVSNAVNALALITSVIALVGILLASPLVHFYAPAFHLVPGKHEMTVAMTRILWPFLPLVVMASVWMGILNARDRYGTPSISSSVFNVISILSAFTLCKIAPHWGYPPIYGMAIGAALGGLGQWVVQMPTLYREGFRYRFYLNFKDAALRKMVILMGAGTFALGATQINILVNSILASSLGNGPVSFLNYAFRLMQFPIGVFGVAIATVNLTRVSHEAAKGDMGGVKKSLVDSLRMAFFLTVPSSVGLAVLGMPIISVIYQHGVFTSDSTFKTSLALGGYAIGLTAYSAVKILVPILYSLGKSRSAILSSGLGVVLNVALCLILIKPLGFLGLSLATSFSAILNAAILLWILEAHIKQIDFKGLAASLGVTLFSSSVMGVVLYFSMRAVGIAPFSPIPLTSLWDRATFSTHLIFLFFSLLVGGGAYALMCKWMGLGELELVLNRLWKHRIYRDKR